MARRLAEQGAPWRPGIGWPLVLAEGLVLLVGGLLILLQTQWVRSALLFALGGYLVVNSGLRVYAAMRAGRASPDVQVMLVRGSIGLIVGLLVVLQPWLPYLDFPAAMTVLAVGLVVSGLLGLVNTVIGREEGDLRWGSLVSGGLGLLLGGVIFYGMSTGVVLLEWLGYLALAGGILLLAYAFLLYQRSGRAAPV